MTYGTDKETQERGIAYATVQCRDLLQNGAPGIPLDTFNRAASAVKITKTLRSEGWFPLTQKGESEMKLPTKALLWSAGALASLCLTGCGGSSSGTSAPTLMPRSVATTFSNGLTATLLENRSAVSVGGSVNYTLTLTNSTAQPITYKPALSGSFLSSAPAYLAITDPAGNLAFPTGVFAQIGGVGLSTTLAPGQSASGTVSVGSTSQGGYSVTGQYTATASFAVFEGGTATSSGTEINASAGPLTVTAH